MTKRIEITDEMVDRAATEMHRNWWVNRWGTSEAMRAALDAALNPPAELEIPVSEGMIRVGEQEVVRLHGANRGAIAGGAIIDVYSVEKTDASLIYRAMEKKRREEQGATFVPFHSHRRKDDPA